MKGPREAVEALKSLENKIGVRDLDHVARELKEAGVETSGCEIKTFLTESVGTIEKLLRDPHMRDNARRAERRMEGEIKHDVRKVEHRMERKH